jgi:hypothetical protein
MFEYELHLARREELQRTAGEWRLAQQAKAAQADRRAAERRAPRREPVRRGQDPADGSRSGRRRSRTLRPHGA